ncbi:MAG: hypothetical protein ACPG19_12280 [Saprospiraceae bacterium]
MKKTLILLTFTLITTSILTAQRYNTAIGARVSKGAGLTLQQRIGDQYTAEAIVFTDLAGNNDFVALGEYHGKIVFQKRLNWYAGAGFHAGTLKDHDNTYGFALIGGVEFTMKRFNISIDYMPLVNFTDTPNTFEATPAISVRYVLWKRPRNNMITKMKDKREDRKKDRAKKKNKKNKKSLKDRILNKD